MALDTCTVTLTTDAAAISGTVVYEPMPGQVVGGVFVDTRPVPAEAAANTYTAKLKRNVKYRLKAPRFPFTNAVFTTPAAGTADLADLLEGYRGG